MGERRENITERVEHSRTNFPSDTGSTSLILPTYQGGQKLRSSNHCQPVNKPEMAADEIPYVGGKIII